MKVDTISALQGERRYQDQKWGDHIKDPAAYLTYMRHWLTRAEQEITKDETPDRALHSIRKITALGIACMDQHGAPPRIE